MSFDLDLPVRDLRLEASSFLFGSVDVFLFSWFDGLRRADDDAKASVNSG